MKIGYLGGIKNGEDTDVLISHDKTKLDWGVRREVPTENIIRRGNTIIHTNNQNYDYYNLMLLTRDGEQKFFYVLNSLERSEIERLSSEFWDKSDVIGYVFN